MRLYADRNRTVLFITWVVLFAIVALIRLNESALSHDERLYLGFKPNVDLPFRRQVVSEYFSLIYSVLGVRGIAIVNILVVGFSVGYLGRQLRRLWRTGRIINGIYVRERSELGFFYLWLLLPATLLISAMYVRDLYILLVVFLFLRILRIASLRTRLSIAALCGILAVLRPELLLIGLLAWGIALIRLKPIWLASFAAVVWISLAASQSFRALYVLTMYRFESERFTGDVTLLGLDPSFFAMAWGGIANAVLFFFPGVIVAPSDKLSMLLLVDGVISAGIVAYAVKGYTAKAYKDVYMRFLFALLICSSIYGVLQIEPETATRYRLAFLPVLASLVIGQRRANFEASQPSRFVSIGAKGL